MGLESGWNCHISLTAPDDVTSSKEDLDTLPNFNHHQENDKDEAPTCKNNRLGVKRSSCPKPGKTLEEAIPLLPRCSASVPEMVLLAGSRPYDEICASTEANSVDTDAATLNDPSFNDSYSFSFCSEEEPSTVRVRFNENSQTAEAEQKSPSYLGSTSSAVLSPDSFPEMYELVEQPTPLGIDLTNRVRYNFENICCFNEF